MAVERSFKMFGQAKVDILVSSATSDGAVCVLTEHIAPGEGVPAHAHAHEDEFIKPLEGEFEVLTGGQWSMMPLEGMFFPRGSGFHAFRCVGSSPGKVLGVITPGGLEEFLAKHADLRMPDDAAIVAALAAEYGITYAADD